MTGRTRVLIVDDHPLFRNGLRQVIQNDNRFDLVGEAGDGTVAWQFIQDLAGTLIALKNASTDAEVQKQSAKINALNGQLTVLSAIRKDQADQVAAQKAANDARSDEERMAAEELAAKDDYLANQRITTYMQTIKLRQNEPQ